MRMLLVLPNGVSHRSVEPLDHSHECLVYWTIVSIGARDGTTRVIG